MQIHQRKINNTMLNTLSQVNFTHNCCQKYTSRGQNIAFTSLKGNQDEQNDSFESDKFQRRKQEDKSEASLFEGAAPVLAALAGFTALFVASKGKKHDFHEAARELDEFAVVEA